MQGQGCSYRLRVARVRVCREYQKYNAVDDPRYYRGCKLIQCMPCVFSTNRKLAAPVYSYSMRAIQLSKQNNADSVKSEV